jgi:hypothetical protein
MKISKARAALFFCVIILGFIFLDVMRFWLDVKFAVADATGWITTGVGIVALLLGIGLACRVQAARTLTLVSTMLAILFYGIYSMVGLYVFAQGRMSGVGSKGFYEVIFNLLIAIAIFLILKNPSTKALFQRPSIK